MHIKYFSLKTTVAAAAMSLAFAGPAFAGSVSGTIKLSGAAPAAKNVSVNKDAKVCGKNPIVDESFLVKGGGLANVVITIKGAKGGKFPKSMSKATIDQNGCAYSPRITIVKAGAKLTVLNSDKILHNVHTHPGKTGNSVANLAQPKFKKKLKMSKRYFKKPGIVKITCDVHDWMTGYVVATDTPFVGVSGDGGKFKISEVPDGSYDVEIWHEKLGIKTVKVTVKGDTTLDTTLDTKLGS
jgi:plastocyanin